MCGAVAQSQHADITQKKVEKRNLTKKEQEDAKAESVELAATQIRVDPASIRMRYIAPADAMGAGAALGGAAVAGGNGGPSLHAEEVTVRYLNPNAGQPVNAVAADGSVQLVMSAAPSHALCSYSSEPVRAYALQTAKNAPCLYYELQVTNSAALKTMGCGLAMDVGRTDGLPGTCSHSFVFFFCMC